MSQFSYVGGELELFAEAHRWKRYLRAVIQPWIRGDVLEVGAGRGATTLALCPPDVPSWTCLEPDPDLAAVLTSTVRDIPGTPAVVNGTLADLPANATYDTVLYIDVLEHIADDAAEVQAAAGRLAPGGHLIVLCPAHQFLYSPFDKQIGHHRRYDAAMMRALPSPGLSLTLVRYLDSAGFLVSLGNRLLLRSAHPTRGQVLLWDRLFVPLSRVTDAVTMGRVGKSVLAIWTKPDGAGAAS